MPTDHRGAPRRLRAAGARRGRRASDARLTGQRPKQQAGDARALLARLTETPSLARAIPRLAPEQLYAVVQRCGLEDCGELLTLATSEQLSAVLDLDLWRIDHTAGEERFDASRFCAWLEALLESGAAAAARSVALMDPSLVTAGLAPQVAVFDPAVFAPASESDESDMRRSAAVDGRPTLEVGGYTIVGRRTEYWDTIVAVLVALSEEHPDRFHRVMRGCRQLSNSRPEVDGLHDLLADSEQTLFDLGFERERRRDSKGYVTPAQARAFLDSSRQLSLEQDVAPPPSPVFTAYLRALGTNDDSKGRPSREPETSDEPATPGEPASRVTPPVDVLLDAGLAATRPRALIGGSRGELPGPPRLREQMELARACDESAFSRRTQELAFLANVVVAGCTVQARALTSREAGDAVAATCNLGLENWPLPWLGHSAPALASVDATGTLPHDFLVHADLTTVFQVGWAVLHRDVSMHAAAQLLSALADVSCSDRETQFGLHVLRKELTKHWRAGEPWRARTAFDVLAVLDMPAWAALLGLIDELPIMLDHLADAGKRQRSIDTAAFEFIADNGQIASVRRYLRSVPQALTS